MTPDGATPGNQLGVVVQFACDPPITEALWQTFLGDLTALMRFHARHGIWRCPIDGHRAGVLTMAVHEAVMPAVRADLELLIEAHAHHGFRLGLLTGFAERILPGPLRAR